MMAGATPTRTSVKPNLAASSATERSHAAASPTPPPMQCPAIRATTGLVESWMAASNSASPSRRVPPRRFPAPGPGPVGLAPERSAPAQNAGPLFVSTITPTDSSASAASRPWASPPISAGVSALRLCGWSMVSVATASRTA